MKIISVVGARPNFMKIAPFIKAIDDYNALNNNSIEHLLVHTGQHYDDRMSRSFFEQLEIPAADINLGIGSGSHAEQVGQTMIAFEKVVKMEKPDWVVVVGDVNAILACSVTAKKEHVLCCHIEAGLRSGDMDMPEEINRLVADRLSDLLLTPDTISSENLRKEGLADDKIVFTGNIMIDTLERNRVKASVLKIEDIIKNNRIGGGSKSLLEIKSENFALMTLHRPSNVDSKEVLEPIVRFMLDEVCRDMPLLWTVHPRTRKMLESFGLWEEIMSHENLIPLEPLGYLEMLKLNMHTKIILTDSGGLQEECTVLGTPCLTLRWNTERPVTLIEHGGASVLVGNNINRIREEYQKALLKARKPVRPELWDGKTAGRCLGAILDYKITT
ncbi:MAG: UDP-N-acetylglucosamine 2-epimerase (non-hydrolyzing) [Bacteroidales bacterium]|nr:UDP-N-acetylglucosamine 2-epimerase (non-hydrolyzing) [Bacteroidales bacterium]MCF8390290.1 UDP-N-acetylglucosamine 2-epimerase (non-hydrolyzing) [Bacteroidales bacterium]